MNPKVSIIVPVYKVEEYLEKCLESIINQTFKDIEIICINDGSTDNSLCILEQYATKDNRIKIINQENKGLATARNVGLKNANGKYITFIDSDDGIELEMIEILYNDISKSDADFVVCGTNLKWISFDKLSVEQYIQDRGYFEISEKGVRDVKDSDFGYINVAAWNKIFKKELIDKFDIKFPVGILNEDACFFWQYLSVSEKVFFEPKKLYNYLRREGSIMMQTYSYSIGLKALDHAKVAEIFYDFLIKHDLYEKLYVAFWNCYDVSALYSINNAGEDSTMFKARKMIYEFMKDKIIDTKRLPEKIAEQWNKFKIDKECTEYYINRFILFGCIPLFSIKYNSQQIKVILFNFIKILDIKGEFRDVKKYKNFDNLTDIQC